MDALRLRRVKDGKPPKIFKKLSISDSKKLNVRYDEEKKSFSFLASNEKSPFNYKKSLEKPMLDII